MYGVVQLGKPSFYRQTRCPSRFRIGDFPANLFLSCNWKCRRSQFNSLLHVDFHYAEVAGCPLEIHSAALYADCGQVLIYSAFSEQIFAQLE
jgi:hypothetical protein